MELAVNNQYVTPILPSLPIMKQMRGYHDVGGSPAPALNRAEHDHAPWEKQIDAMQVLLCGERKLYTTDEVRYAVEHLPPEAYDNLTYYERWIAAIADNLLRRGIITSAELGRKMEEVQSRREAERE
jgi:hypothetical protein